MRVIALLTLSAAAVMAQDAASLLAKAHDAFVKNRERERYWNWTTTTTRIIVDKKGAALEQLPSFTVESPIRSDGRRCNALIAWGDALEPYLANAAADERCKVAEEMPQNLQILTMLEPRPVRIAGRKGGTVTLELRQNKELMDATDPVTRCGASVTATVQLDAASYFPKRIEVRAPNTGCETRHVVTDHYENTTIPVNSGPTKESSLIYIFELEKDKAGDPERDFWIAASTHAHRALKPWASAIVNWGRSTPLRSRGARFLEIDTNTTASELTAESRVTFDVSK